MSRPRVSILMVSYNSSRFIGEAIESVLSQTFTDFELVLCDDSSADPTWTIINEYRDERIVKSRNERNIGEYANRNKAIGLARGEYLIFVDADDIIYPHGLEFMMNYAASFSDCGMIISRPWDERIIYPMRLTSHQLYCFEYLDSGAIGINFTKVLFKTDPVKPDVFPDAVKLGDLYLQYEIGLHQQALLIPDASTWWRRANGQASEKLLRRYDLYLREELWIKLDKLKDPRCPLTTVEKRLAYKNIYGNYLRYLLSLFFRFRILSVIQIYSQYPVPLKYLFAIFTKQRRNYFSSFNGNHPMRSTS